MISCKYCGEPNPFDRILCLKCGKTLDKANPELLQTTEPLPQKIVYRQTESFAGTLLLYVFTVFLFICLFLLFYSGGIPEPVLSLSAAKNLDEKILQLTKKNAPCVPLTQEELNILLEREWSGVRESINTALPSFIRLNRIFLTLGEHDLTLYLHFMIKHIPIFISFTGMLHAENQEMRLNIRKSSVGALRLPFPVTHYLTRPILRECIDHKRFSLPYGIQNLDITNFNLFVYKNPDFKSSSKPDEKSSVPSDLLLIQAGDVCLSKNEREKAEKYFRLALLHYPSTPLKSHIQDQLKLCSPEKESEK